MNNPIESKPLFAVGEVVILQSVMYPEVNGEKTVLGILRPGEVAKCPISGLLFRKASMSAFGYILDDGVLTKYGTCGLWAEFALRKRHQPGEYSFEDLKTILYLPQSRDEIARLERGMQA